MKWPIFRTQRVESHKFLWFLSSDWQPDVKREQSRGKFFRLMLSLTTSMAVLDPRIRDDVIEIIKYALAHVTFIKVWKAYMFVKRSEWRIWTACQKNRCHRVQRGL